MLGFNLESEPKDMDLSMFRPATFTCKDCGQTEAFASLVFRTVAILSELSAWCRKDICSDCNERIINAWREKARWIHWTAKKRYEQLFYCQGTINVVSLPEVPRVTPVLRRLTQPFVIADEVDEYSKV